MKSKLILSALFVVFLSAICEAKGTKTLYVADRTIPCAGTVECIQIKEKAKSPWHIYSDTIDGFNYEEGYEYKLSVKPVPTLNTLSGFFEERYRLLKIVSKKKTNFKLVDKLADKKWLMKSMDDMKRTLGVPDTSGIFMAFDLKANSASGKGVCNTFHCTFSTQGSKISFTDFGMTKMLCKGQAFEGIVFGFIKKATTYTVKGNLLTLKQPDGSNIVFEGR